MYQSGIAKLRGCKVHRDNFRLLHAGTHDSVWPTDL